MTVNVELTDTFGAFKNKTNEIIAMTQSSGMNQAIRITESTNSSSSTTGSVVTSGGVGVAKSVTIGQNLTIVGKLSSSIIPETTDSIDIGSSSLYWRDVYTRGMNANVVTTAASLVVPVGATGDRVATQGGIRYNTTTTLFEGYTGSDWTPLNGVIDAESASLAALADECLRNLEEGVRDKELREKLRPDYRAGCKRLIFSTDFYESIQRDNANLITSGIVTVEENGIRTEDGEFHELDVLVVATGFKADAFIRPATVLGRDGIDLDDAWSDYPSAYMSVSIPKFPNFFMLNGPNSPVGNFSLIQIAENQLDYLLQLMNEIRLGNCSQISATRNATEAFEERRIEATKKTVWNTGCKSWYLDKNGIPSSWPWSRQQFFDEMERPELEAFERI